MGGISLNLAGGIIFYSYFWSDDFVGMDFMWENLLVGIYWVVL